VRKRKTTYALLGPLPHAVAYVGAPLAISRLGEHHGWRDGRPGPANLLGVVPLAAGAAMLAWAIASHYETAPDEAKITALPTYLVKGGAYAVTRNPMYVGGAAMQTGWAMCLGSVPVAATCALYLAGMASVGVPFEERFLQRRFGASYDAYRAQVPRWLSLRRVSQRG
jgi:protein-S-isoprenylcysteine O-methyltransferase Ste14